MTTASSDRSDTPNRLLTRRETLRYGLVGAATFSMLGLAACGGSTRVSSSTSGSGSAARGGTFKFSQSLDAVTLDPPHAYDDTSLDVMQQLFDGLVRVHPTEPGVLPALAVEVPEPENGGKRYTFKLREGVTFHDGTPLDAEAVKFNVDRWRETKNPYHQGGGAQGADFGNYQSLMEGFDSASIIRKVTVVDPLTVRIDLREPRGSFLTNMANLAFAIASPTAVKKDVKNFWKAPVGTGPFAFESWKRGSQVTLKAHPTWWGADLPEEEGGTGPFLDRISYVAIPDASSRIAALVSGDSDGTIGMAPDDIDSLKQGGEVAVSFRPALAEGHLAINMRTKPLGDVRVRQAIAYALDIPTIVKTFFRDTGEIAGSFFPSALAFADTSIEPYPHDPERAKALLREAGLPRGFSVDFWYLPIPRAYMPDPKGIAQAMQTDLAKAGIKVKLVTYEFGTYLEKLGRGEHDLALIGGSTGGSTDPDYLLNYRFNSINTKGSAATNQSYYIKPEMDKLIEQARQAVNDEARAPLYAQAQAMIHEDVPVVPIAYARTPLGVRSTISGLKSTPAGERFHTIQKRA